MVHNTTRQAVHVATFVEDQRVAVADYEDGTFWIEFYWFAILIDLANRQLFLFPGSLFFIRQEITKELDGLGGCRLDR